MGGILFVGRGLWWGGACGGAEPVVGRGLRILPRLLSGHLWRLHAPQDAVSLLGFHENRGGQLNSAKIPAGHSRTSQALPPPPPRGPPPTTPLCLRDLWVGLLGSDRCRACERP